MKIENLFSSEIMKEKSFRRILIIMGIGLIVSGILIGYHPVSAITAFGYSNPASGTSSWGGLAAEALVIFDSNAQFKNLSGFGISGMVYVGNASAYHGYTGTWTGYDESNPSHTVIVTGVCQIAANGMAFATTSRTGELTYSGTHLKVVPGSGFTGFPNVRPGTISKYSNTGAWWAYPGGSGYSYFFDNTDYPLVVTPYPTPPAIPGSCWANTTNWTNESWQYCINSSGLWNLTPGYNTIPYFPWNLTWTNLTNRSNITNLFNSSLIDITLVNTYLDIVDSIFNGLKAIIASILGILMAPITWLAQQMLTFVDTMRTYITYLLYYLKPVAIIFQIIINIIPPVLIYLGTVCLCFDFAWWVLYGRK